MGLFDRTDIRTLKEKVCELMDANATLNRRVDILENQLGATLNAVNRKGTADVSTRLIQLDEALYELSINVDDLRNKTGWPRG